MAPLKKWPEFPQYFTLGALSWGVLALSLGIAAVTGVWSFSIVGFVCGFIWHYGGAFCFSAVKHESDLSGTSVRSMGMCILSSFLSGLFIFGEPVVWWLAIIAMIVLCSGLVILSPDFRGIWKKWRSLLAGLIFGLHLVPFQLSGLSNLEFALPYAVGIFVGSNLLLLQKRKTLNYNGKSKAPWLASAAAGALWMVGTHGSFWAIDPEGSLGFAIGYPLVQLNLLVNIGIGVFIFGEYQGKKNRIKLACAAATILTGAVLLTLAKITV